MNNQTKKSINIKYFDSFLNITGINIFIKKFEKDYKKAQFLLEMHNYESYVDMLSEGYIPTKKQQETLDNFIETLLSTGCNYHTNNTLFNVYEENYERLENLLKNGLKLNYKNIARILHSQYESTFHDSEPLSNNKEVLYQNNYIMRTKNIDLPFLTKQFREIIQQSKFSDYLLKDFKENLNTKLNNYKKSENGEYIIRRYKLVLTHTPELIFKNADSKEILSLIKKLNYPGIIQEDSKILNNINTVYYQDRKVDVINQIQNLHQLPKNALVLVNSIQITYDKIKSTNFNDIENLHKLDNLFNKFVPEVLNKYFQVDSKYRQSITSTQKKNAEELMIDSLLNIKNSFDNIYFEINQGNVNSLSATNRYTKSLKK